MDFSKGDGSLYVHMLVSMGGIKDGKLEIKYVSVTEANLQYVGSVTIDTALMETADIFPNEEVQIVNNNNGARFETYAIPGERNSRTIF